MTFLEAAPLVALPLAALPVIIHLVHLYRRKQVPWAAMMFLRAAQKMSQGFSRLKQILILGLRVLAVAAILLAIARPLAGGWLGLTGGAPDTVLVLLDRSASMEQQNPAIQLSKRQAGLKNLSQAISDAVGTRSKLVLLESGTGNALEIPDAKALLDLPQTAGTESGADIPGLLQKALDYLTSNKTGQTDLWILSDLQKGDWDRSSGRWENLRSAFKNLPGVRFHLLTYPQPPGEDLGIRIRDIQRRATETAAELLVDLRITRKTAPPHPEEIPLRIVINGVATTTKVTLKDSELVLQAFPIPIEKNLVRGWGRIELPEDAYPANNVFHFVFDDPPPLQSAIVTEDEAETDALVSALTASSDPQRKAVCAVLPAKRAAEIAWEKTALLVWHAPIPKPEDALFRQLQQHAASGRSVVFLPPNVPDDSEIFGLRWGPWLDAQKPLSPDGWRTDSDLLANTRDGAALPVGTLELSRLAKIMGPGIPLARIPEHGPLLLRALGTPGAYFLGTLPGAGSSSLAREGVVLFVMLQRALNDGARTLGNLRQQVAGAGALPEDPAHPWKAADEKNGPRETRELGLRAGVFQSGERLHALNRPEAEDDLAALAAASVNELFEGLDFKVLSDTLESTGSLTREVWRTFLIAMALALLGEAILCMPPRRTQETPRVGGIFQEPLREK